MIFLGLWRCCGEGAWGEEKVFSPPKPPAIPFFLIKIDERFGENTFSPILLS
jgi:hypothetical protein